MNAKPRIEIQIAGSSFFTVVGYWSGDEVVVTGIVKGVHEVFGGTDETGDGLFADSFSVPEDADDVEAALREAIAAEYYG